MNYSILKQLSLFFKINKKNFNFTNIFEKYVWFNETIKNDIKSNSEKINHKNKNKIKKFLILQ